jgi:hypothetical protein
MAEEKPIKGRPVAFDNTADSATEGMPGFLARPVGAPVYHGFQILNVTVEGFSLGIITGLDSGEATDGDAFIIAPDKSRAGLVWELSDEDTLAEICPIEKDRWGVWGVSFPLKMSSDENMKMNLQAILPKLKPKWEQWRQRFSTGDHISE